LLLYHLYSTKFCLLVVLLVLSGTFTRAIFCELSPIQFQSFKSDLGVDGAKSKLEGFLEPFGRAMEEEKDSKFMLFDTFLTVLGEKVDFDTMSRTPFHILKIGNKVFIAITFSTAVGKAVYVISESSFQKLAEVYPGIQRFKEEVVLAVATAFAGGAGYLTSTMVCPQIAILFGIKAGIVYNICTALMTVVPALMFYDENKLSQDLQEISDSNEPVVKL